MTDAAQLVVIVSVEWDVVDLIESCPGFTVVGFIDPSSKACSRGLPNFGADEQWPKVRAEMPGLLAVLAMDSPDARARLYDHYGGEALFTIQSRYAYVSPYASVGHGSVVQRGVTVMPYARIGKACKLNINTTVHHEAAIGDFCTLAPGAQVLGNVVIEERAFIGAGAIIRQRCRIGAGAIVGAGAVVVEEVSPGAVVVGVPAARRLR